MVLIMGDITGFCQYCCYLHNNRTEKMFQIEYLFYSVYINNQNLATKSTQ